MIVATQQSGHGGCRVPHSAAVAMQKHILLRPAPPYTCATIPATVELAKVWVANMPDTHKNTLSVRQSVHAIVDAWLDTISDLDDLEGYTYDVEGEDYQDL